MPKRGLRSSREGEGFFSKRKVCVVTHGEGKPYKLFFMDLDMNANSRDFIDTKHAIEIVYPIDARFCESNSNLYMFHANLRLPPSRFKNLKGLPLYKIDLSSSSPIWGSDSVITLNPGLGVEGMKGVLIPCPEMKTSKRLFDIARAPDGRIVAFSRMIRHFRSTDEYQLYKDLGMGGNPSLFNQFEAEEDHKLVDFEIFDPRNESWSSLPELGLVVPGSPYKSMRSFRVLKIYGEWEDYLGSTDDDTSLYDGYCELYHIGGGSFIGNVFHVVVYMGSVKKGFYLNIDDLQGGWRASPAQITAPKISEEPFLQVGREDLILSSRFIRRGSTLQYPLRWPITWRMTSGISVLDTFTERCVACVAAADFHPSLSHPCIMCHVFSIDLSRETSPQLLATFNYMKREERKFHHHEFRFHSVFPISATEESLGEELQEKRCKII